MPDNATIAANPAELHSAAAKLNAVRENLSSQDLIKPLIFGESGAAHTSKGGSVSSMELLNAELDAVAKKLSVLSEATASFIEKATATIEAADQG